jgi:hypothetical protein
MSETTMTTGLHLNSFERPTIGCTTSETASRPDGYPVLHLGPVTIWPTVEQLRAIRAAIDGWPASPDGVKLSGPHRPDAIC